MKIIKSIQNRIYEIRGERVMIDFDVAALYEVETRVLNQAVKRNIKRFPKDFMFQLTTEEFDDLRFQIETIEKSMSSQIVMTYPAKRPKSAIPYAFTEHGVTMLASVLKSKKAIQMNISIVRAFIALKRFALDYKELADKIAKIESKCNRQFKDVYEALNLLLDDKEKGKQEEKNWKEREKIGYK